MDKFDKDREVSGRASQKFRRAAFEVLTSEQQCDIGSGLPSWVLQDDDVYS